jgi:hypothetical protein
MSDARHDFLIVDVTAEASTLLEDSTVEELKEYVNDQFEPEDFDVTDGLFFFVVEQGKCKQFTISLTKSVTVESF